MRNVVSEGNSPGLALVLGWGLGRTGCSIGTLTLVLGLRLDVLVLGPGLGSLVTRRLHRDSYGYYHGYHHKPVSRAIL